jgi:hypothetical protein
LGGGIDSGRAYLEAIRLIDLDDGPEIATAEVVLR